VFLYSTASEENTVSKRHKGYRPPIDSLGRNDSAVWLVARDQWGRRFENRRLRAGTDLFEILLAEALRYHREGWSLGDRPFFNCEFHVSRPGEPPRLVTFSSLGPDQQPLRATGKYYRGGYDAQFPKPNNQRWA
jgi:hypothetical protein